jgi:hypothetical protein
MMLSDISTELLIKLRERFRSGRTRFSVLAEGRPRPTVADWMQERLILVVEDELRRRLH